MKSLATLAVLGVLLLLAAIWGWDAATQPLPERADPPVCIDRTYGEGDRLEPRDVTVSVWNGGTRNGLAGLTMGLLTDAGFGEGQEGNAPKDADVAMVQVWTELPRKHPAVVLVRSQFDPEPRVVKRDTDAAGVLLVVGDQFNELAKGRRRVKVTESVEVCGPPVAS